VAKDEDDLTPASQENITLEELQQTWIGRSNDPCLFISATKKTNIPGFKNLLSKNVKDLYAKRYPYKTFHY